MVRRIPLPPKRCSPVWPPVRPATGAQGQGTDNDYFPRLAGKPADYLFNQLQNFREGRRRYPPMNYLVTYLSDDYLHQIATYFSNMRPPYPTPAAATLSDSQVAHGQGHRAARRPVEKTFPPASPATARA